MPLSGDKMPVLSGSLTSSLDTQGNAIINLVTPVNPGDAANKAYVDAINRPPTKVVFLTTVGAGTYTPSAGVRAIFVECVGGGGAGGGAATSSSQESGGSGGGGGAYSAVYLASPKASYPISIGAGGTSVSGAAGIGGGDTTFDSPSVCTAKGGTGGQFASPSTAYGQLAGGFGGLESSGVGDLKVGGSGGGIYVRLSGTNAWTGNGGSSVLGGGGAAQQTGTAGLAGHAYGGGGAGSATSSIALAGGPGAQGVIMVTEYF